MKSAFFAGKYSPGMQGKALLIVIVVLFSSLSFALGFMVGKYGREKRPEAVITRADAIPMQPVRETGPRTAGETTAPPEATSQPKETVAASADRKPPEKQAAKTLADAGADAAKEKRPAVQTASEDAKDAIVYTVQLGAVKNREEAENMKANYEKKGYTMFITVWTNKKHEKIFKIRAGEFADRKEAEILALKFKKNEGLSPFVTFID